MCQGQACLTVDFDAPRCSVGEDPEEEDVEEEEEGYEMDCTCLKDGSVCAGGSLVDANWVTRIGQGFRAGSPLWLQYLIQVHNP